MTKKHSEKPVISCRVICIGNTLIDADSGGPRVYELLKQSALPPGLEVLDGGLAGLNLLGCLEHIEIVIFVDCVRGFLPERGIMVLELPHPAVKVQSFGHEAGIGYLLAVAPYVLDTALPTCFLVGIEGTPDNDLAERAAEACLQLFQTTGLYHNANSSADCTIV